MTTSTSPSPQQQYVNDFEPIIANGVNSSINFAAMVPQMLVFNLH